MHEYYGSPETCDWIFTPKGTFRVAKDGLVSYFRNERCTECGVLGEHRPWCIFVNENLQEAFAVLINETVRPEADEIRAHGLGIKLRS